MRRLLPVSTLVLGLLLASALPARACINDREVQNHEREFKSAYLKDPYGPSSPPETAAPATESDWKLIGAAGLGLGLLASAAVVGLTRAGGRR
jgi:hypothetical protein